MAASEQPRDDEGGGLRLAEDREAALACSC